MLRMPRADECQQYVQYGCGFSAPDSWRNFDASPTLRLERLPLFGRLVKKNAARFPANVEYGDIVKGLPVADNSCMGVYCSHVLEHLSLMDCRKALANTYRILAPDGIFRLVLPDLEQAVSEYVSDQSPEASIRFMRGTSLGLEERPRGMKSIIVTWIGNSAHLWMWDFKSLRKELANAGFCSIRRAYFNDSGIPQFRSIEVEARWQNSLGIECVRRP